MTTILLAVGIMAMFFALMSVRLLFLKNGEFKGTCATQSPVLRENGVDCLVCGKKAGEECKNEIKDVKAA
ncbi:hypothetical protein [Rhodoflexus sp.]